MRSVSSFPVAAMHPGKHTTGGVFWSYACCQCFRRQCSRRQCFRRQCFCQQSCRCPTTAATRCRRRAAHLREGGPEPAVCQSCCFVSTVVSTAQLPAFAVVVHPPSHSQCWCKLSSKRAKEYRIPSTEKNTCGSVQKEIEIKEATCGTVL